MEQQPSKSRECALRRPHSLRVLPSEDPRVTLPPPYRAAHSIASRAISNQLHGDKWIAAHYAVSTFDILISVSFGVNVPNMSPAQHRIEAVPMADETIASIIPLHQPKKAKTGAQRARAYRQRKRQKAKAAASPNRESPSSESLIPEGFLSADSAFAEPPFTPPPTVTLRAVARDQDPPSRRISSTLLRAAALALAARFPEREEYVISTSEFQRVKARLLRLSNARASTSGALPGSDEGAPGRPTLKRRQPTPDDSTTTPDGGIESKPGDKQEPPKLKKNDGAKPSQP